jgi:hypothetical protein
MKTLFTIFLFAIAIYCKAQSEPIEKDICPDCNIPCMCKLYFKNYLPDSTNHRIIKRNWNDFFAENLNAFYEMPKNLNTVDIKFDGLGCIYPENNTELINIKGDFLGKDESDYKKFFKHSFYNLFNLTIKGEGNTTIDRFVKQEAFQNSFKQYGNDIEYFDFIRKWNAKHIPAKVKQINAITTNIKLKKVVVFIHGYNVPYSLAVFQNKVMIDKILKTDNDLKSEEVLFISVYWPSGNRKKDKFEANKCDYNNIESPKTAKAFTYYSNRAYLSAIFIRRIIREMYCQVPIDIITHSHGSTLATTTLINTTTKLQPGILSDSICVLMHNEELPNKEINVFLNAPSIPGVLTFMDIQERTVQSNYRFFVGYNNNDIVLKKQKLKIAKQTFKAIAPSGYLSSTTLGCNKNNEVAHTFSVLEAKKMGYIFKSDINSIQNEHDFFCYVLQPEFMKNLTLFLEGTFR